MGRLDEMELSPQCAQYGNFAGAHEGAGPVDISRIPKAENEKLTRGQKQGFLGAIAPLGKCFPSPLKLKVAHVMLAQDGKSAAVELVADAVCKDGSVFKN